MLLILNLSNIATRHFLFGINDKAAAFEICRVQILNPSSKKQAGDIAVF
jgi:hypothetical protein